MENGKHVKMTVNEGNCKSFGNGRKVMKLWIINLQFQLKKQNKKTNKQSKESTNLNHFMWKKIRSKMKKTKTKMIIIIKREERKEKKREIKKLIKMAMEAIILMIYWHHKIMKVRNNSRTKHVEKKNNNK